MWKVIRTQKCVRHSGAIFFQSYLSQSWSRSKLEMSLARKKKSRHGGSGGRLDCEIRPKYHSEPGFGSSIARWPPTLPPGPRHRPQDHGTVIPDLWGRVAIDACCYALDRRISHPFGRMTVQTVHWRRRDST